MLKTLWGPWVVLLGIVAGLALGIAGLPLLGRFLEFDGVGSSSCDIKGNISSSGERIYHVPGQKYFRVTAVNRLRGVRWFCSEAEARAAGWRRARR